MNVFDAVDVIRSKCLLVTWYLADALNGGHLVLVAVLVLLALLKLLVDCNMLDVVDELVVVLSNVLCSKLDLPAILVALAAVPIFERLFLVPGVRDLRAFNLLFMSLLECKPAGE